MDSLHIEGSESSTLTGRGLITKEGNKKLRAPVNIMQTVAAARSIYDSYKRSHLKRTIRYSNIEGLIAGNPPYDPKELEASGLSHIANFNNLKAGSLYERGGLAFWNLIHQARWVANFKINKFPDQRIDGDPKLWADVLADEFNKVVHKWKGYVTQASTLSGQLVKFGLSPVIWRDERDWRWRTVEIQRFYVGDQTPADLDQLTCVCFDTVYTAQELFSVYNYLVEKPDEVDGSGWDLDELEYILLNRANSMIKSANRKLTNMMDIQSALTNGDLTHGDVFSDSIHLVSMLYKEYNGKVSHFMFEQIATGRNQFLFQASEQYQCFSEALVIFTSSPGEFTLHGNKGVGHKIFSSCQAMNQLDCSIVDAARWSSTPLIKSIGLGSKEFSQLRFYPGVPTDIGSAEFVQNTMGANVNQLIGVSQYVHQTVEYNAMNSGDDPGMPDRDLGSKSAPQVKMESYQEFGVLRNVVANFYEQFDNVIYNMAAKMFHSKDTYPGYAEAKKWKDRCIARGVPKEIFDVNGAPENHLPEHLEVKASRVAGDGSNLARIMGLEGVGPLVGGFGAKGQAAYQREVILARMGQDYVEEFLQDSNVPDEMAGGASLAALENIAMKMGEMPVFSPDNQHQGHIGTHFALLKDTIERIQKQEINSVEADKIFRVAMPHTAQHLQHIAQDPLAAQFMAKIKQSWAEFSRYAELNASRAQKMMQTEIKRRNDEQAKMEEAQGDAARKDFVTQKDEARKDLKVSSQIERAAEASAQRGEIMHEKNTLDAANQRHKINLDAQNKAHQGKKESEGQKQFDGVPTDELKQRLVDMGGSTPSPNDFEPIA